MKRRLISSIPLIVLLLALAVRVSNPGLIEQVRLATFDSYQRLAPRAYDPGWPVRIVDIDDESLTRLGQWPWPRTILAKLVERLTQAGAAAIAFDIVFADPDRSSPELVLPLWPETPEVRALRESVRGLPSHDAVFAKSLAGSRTVAGFILVDKEGSRLPLARATFASTGDEPAPFVYAFAGAVVNLPSIEQAAKGNGALNWVPDRDQVVRRLPLVFRVGDQLYPSLAAEALRIAQGAGTYVIRSSGASGETAFGEHTGLNAIRIGQFEVPTTANGEMILTFTGPASDRYIPAWRILRDEFDPETVAGRIILIGTSAAGLLDLRATPLAAAVPGVEIHARLIEQVLSGDYLYRPDYFEGVEIAYMLLLGLALIVLLPRIGAAWVGMLGAVAMGIVLGGSWLAYDSFGWLIDPVYPSLAVILVFICGTLVVYLRSEAERHQVRSAFSRYMSPTLVDELAKYPERLVLGGEMREMTLLFCDIRGFTAISEGLDAQQLTAFVNRFLTPMTEIILDQRGTIDKYMGDCVMAFWNAPLDDPEHADHACRAALAMTDRLVELNRSWRLQAEAEGRAHIPVRIGIGLNTGTCCVGNMGSDQRFDYSVVGDDVNLASRLEGETKTYGADILIGEGTRNLVPHMATLPLDTVRVRGKTRPVQVFALIGDEAMAASPEFAGVRERHGRALAALDERDAGAREAIEACRGLAGGRLDGFYNYCLDRLSGD